MLLLKGILLGLFVAVLSLALFLRFIWSSTPTSASGGGATAIDIRTVAELALVFFGGIGIGFGIVATVVLGLIGAFYYHASSMTK